MKKVLLALLVLFVTGCGTVEEQTIKEISPEKAKEYMDTSEKYVLLDVRTRAEFNEIHIEGAVNMTADELPDKFESVTKEKDTLILVYCKSGVRAKNATKVLMDLGYTNVYTFGGIDNWPYDVVK